MELPRDRDGVEIDVTETAVLYAMDGTVRHVESFDVQPGCGMWTVRLREYVEDCAPSNFTVARHDSWEFLLEDLGRVASCGEDSTPTCAYTRQPCTVCKFHSSMSCASAMCADIASRIRRLRGED